MPDFRVEQVAYPLNIQAVAFSSFYIISQMKKCGRRSLFQLILWCILLTWVVSLFSLTSKGEENNNNQVIYFASIFEIFFKRNKKIHMFIYTLCTLYWQKATTASLLLLLGRRSIDHIFYLWWKLVLESKKNYKI